MNQAKKSWHGKHEVFYLMQDKESVMHRKFFIKERFGRQIIVHIFFEMETVGFSQRKLGFQTNVSRKKFGVWLQAMGLWQSGWGGRKGFGGCIGGECRIQVKEKGDLGRGMAGSAE